MNTFCWIATVICIVGTIVNIKRINWCFYCWLVGEIMWLAFDLSSEYNHRAILDAIGVVLAIIGIYINCIKKGVQK